MPNFINITGNKYNYLTVVKRVSNVKRAATRWLCKCDCGNEKVVVGYSLKAGLTQSCGCFQKERVAATNSTHGFARTTKPRTTEYVIWCGMRKRCTNPNEKAYPNYGGRGIKVCERWNNFENFLEDMGKRPSKDHSIDRINNDRGYEPSNCKWSTRLEQNCNRRVRKGSSSKYTGVHLEKVTGKWVVQTYFNRSRKKLGRFNSEEEAKESYDKAKLQFFMGEIEND